MQDDEKIDLLLGVKELPNTYFDKDDNILQDIFNGDNLEDIVEKEFPLEKILDYGLCYLRVVNRTISENNYYALYELNNILLRLPRSNKVKKRLLI